jgi:predicted N-acetyltransferase YhbS
VVRKLKISRGGAGDYEKLAGFHYRNGRLGAYAAIFKLEVESRWGQVTAGVIVYIMPSPGLELRNVATGDYFVGLDRSSQLALINKNIRCIGRVIVEPRFRGLGLGSQLVRETMPEMNVPIIEAAAVMGLVNPFFEKAGMTAYKAQMPVRCALLIEAFSLVGIEKEEFIDPESVHRKLEVLGREERAFINLQTKCFLQPYRRRRDMKSSPERTEFVLSKLTERPVYYIWFNPEIAFT